MDTSVVTAELEIQDAQMEPRQQFVRQVDEESLSAGEILAEQMESLGAGDAAHLFVP